VVQVVFEVILSTTSAAQPWPAVALVVAVAELLAGLLSASEDDTVAVLVIVPAATGVTTMLTVAEAPPAIVPRLHVTVDVPAQFPCEGVAEMKVIPAGRVSVRITPLAVEGPLLVTIRV
jgi:hypothetical protein